MCQTGQCAPFVMTGEAAAGFDRDLLSEYDHDLGGVLHIEDSGSRIVVGFPNNMPQQDKDNAHIILEVWGFE